MDTTASPFRSLSQAQRIHAEQEYLDHQALVYAYLRKSRARQSSHDYEEAFQLVSIALWETCCALETKDNLSGACLSTLFWKAAKWAMLGRQRHNVKLNGIPAQYAFDREYRLKHQQIPISIEDFMANDGEEVLDGYNFLPVASPDPVFNQVARWQKYEALDTEQQVLLEMEADGVELKEMARRMGFSSVASVSKRLQKMRVVLEIAPAASQIRHSLTREVAEQFGIPETNAVNRIYRARKRLGITGKSWDHREQIIEELAA